jgi:N-acetylmuramoyl-L-alanine amidase
MLNIKLLASRFFIATAINFLAINIFSFSAFAKTTEKTSAKTTEISISEIKFDKKNQLQISTSEKTEFKIFILENPSRLVLDIKKAQLSESASKPVLPDFISSFRYKKNPDNLRLVFEITQKFKLGKSQFIKNKKNNSGKILADISGIKNITKPIASKPKADKATPDFIAEKVAEFDVQTEKIINPDGSAKYIVKKTPRKTAQQNVALVTSPIRIPIIVVDPGHGGKDPGTIGNFAHTKEKNITLSYGKELVKQLNKTKRYKAYLTRNDDFFVPLRTRVAKARRIKADLFISIHANAIADKSVSGFSIYTLSEKSSDKQAELLAQKENRADIINGVDFEGASQDIMKTLIDLSQRETKNSSAQFANMVINSVKKSSDVTILQNTHRFAGFAVLTAPDMSSVLIELGYLSNKKEEDRLNSIGYKRKIAENLVTAINEFYTKK